MRGSCWFYWYWRTCWPSLLYFHSMTYMGRKWTTGSGQWLLTHCTCVRTEKLMLLLVGTMQVLFFKICVCCFWCTHIETQTQYILWSTVRHSPNTRYTVVHSQTLETLSKHNIYCGPQSDFLYYNMTTRPDQEDIIYLPWEDIPGSSVTSIQLNTWSPRKTVFS